ncbi:MAG: hypothetical protein FJW32_25580, partial [Acidobacteria bacterium]|nr:hypothetical protein [Acidobacteriota bacterium]
IRAWWDKFPNANIGLATGYEFFAIDIDPAGMAWYEAEQLPATHEAVTGRGGRHVLYRMPTGYVIGNSAGLLAEGVDVRGIGGYIVAPPSVHPSGTTYTWLDCDGLVPDGPCADAPPEIIAALAHRPETSGPLTIPNTIKKGVQHRTLHSLASSLRAKGLEQPEIEAALIIAARRCEEVPPDSHMARLAESVCKRYQPGLSPDYAARQRQRQAVADDSPLTAIIEEPERVKSWTEAELADALIRDHGHALRYVASLSKWFHYDGVRWIEDDTQAIYRLALALVRKLRFRKGESSAKLKSVVTIAGTHQAAAGRIADFDVDDFLLNFQNGVVDLRNGNIGRHRRDHFMTRVIPFAFNRHAHAPRWDRFLGEIFEPHCDLAEWIQKAVGYSLTGDVREHCFFLMHGNRRNGKGVFGNTLRRIFGDYAHQADFRAFAQKYGDGPLDGIANMRGARFALCSEMPQGARFDEALLKTLTGGDSVRARLLHANSFEIRPTFKLWFATNHKPNISDNDAALWARTRLIPFDVSFFGREDRTLGDALISEAEGVIAWAVEGAMRWREEGLEPLPKAVRCATETFEAESDVLARFIAERCTLGEFYSAQARVLYRAYVAWAEATGERPMKETAFGLRMVTKKFEKSKTERGVQYNGLKVREE